MIRRAFLSRVALALFFGGLVGGPALAVATFDKSELTIDSAGTSHHFFIEVARSNEQMTQGLMFRSRLAPDAGMLFIYARPQPASMWMYQTLIPLDMLFIGPDGRIINIHERAVPLSTDTISSDGPVRAVLELNGGTVARLKLKPGDRVHHADIAN